MFKSPHKYFIADFSMAVVLLWFSVACFWCQSFGECFTLCVFWVIAAHSIGHMFSLYFDYL